MPPSGHELLRRLDDLQAKVMFTLSCIFLVLLAGLLHQHQALTPEDLEGFFSRNFLSHIFAWDFHNFSRLEVQIFFSGFIILWPIFVVEAVARFLMRERTSSLGRSLAFTVLVIAVPPLRIAAGRRGQSSPHIWLPFVGWHAVNKQLRKSLEKWFSVPMIFMALMVVPLLAAHYGWDEQINNYWGLALFLDVGNALVWFAFAFEFIVMVSVADKKWRYCVLHWLELAIILLPLIEFLPALRILRLSQLGRMGRAYRVKGLAMKAWRALLLLELLQRLMGQSLETRLERLKELLAAKEEECDDLRKEIEQLKEQIAREKKGEQAKDA